MEIVSLFNKGGVVMYPILAASVITVMITIERYLYYQRSQTDVAAIEHELPAKLMNRDFQGAEQILSNAGGVAGLVLLHGLKNIHQPGSQREILEGAANRSAYILKKYLNLISVIVTMAPLLGLLGTVIGMVQSFNVLSVADSQPFAITGGVGEALIATATGLMAAIVALSLHTFLLHRANSLIADIEYVSAIYLTALHGGNNEN
jgi:biopolymer transport protein ExbB